MVRELTKQEARILARVMRCHGFDITVFGISITGQVNCSAHRRWRWWWY